MRVSQGMHTSVMYFIPAVMFALLQAAGAKKDKDLMCGACQLIVEEMGVAIARVDPKKTIQVGSYRIDPSGNQRLNEIPYARSEVHLSEQLDEVCDHLPVVGRSKDRDGIVFYIKTKTPDGTPLAMKDMMSNNDVNSAVKYACHNLLEDHEDELIEFLKKKGVSDPEEEFCSADMGFCAEGHYMKKIMKQAEAMMAGMRERAAPESSVEEDDDEEEDEGVEVVYTDDDKEIKQDEESPSTPPPSDIKDSENKEEL